MQLNKKLTIVRQKAELAGEDVRLRYMQPGTAMFTIRSEDEPYWFLGKMVRYSMGWNVQDALVMFFTGFIVDAVQAGQGLVRLLCRENVARLDNILPLALRHPTLEDVLKAYAGQSGIRFIVPPKAYAKTRVPAFYALGSGIHGLQSLGAVFSISDYFWQTTGDGGVYVGSYPDCAWAEKNTRFPQEYFKGAAGAGTRHIGAVPSLRPGVILNGRRIQAIAFKGREMEVTC